MLFTVRYTGVFLLVFLAASGAVFAADAIPGEDFCTQPVAAIEFSGNDVTRPQVMLREMQQQINAVCSIDQIVDGIQNMLNLGLFRSVRAELAMKNQQLVLHMIVVEKYFFLALPRFSRTSDGELRGGMQLRWDNFTGRLHELRLTAERRREDNGQGREGFVYRIDYKVPRFFGSDYGVSFRLADQRQQVGYEQDDITFGEGNRDDQSFQLTLVRWWNRSSSISGLSISGGLRVQRRQLEVLEGEAGPFVGGADINLLLGFKDEQTHRDVYRRHGREYGGYLQISSPELGSDFRYHSAEIYARWYNPLPGGIRNLNVQARIGVSDGAPFGERAFQIGGGELLRGVQPGTKTGEPLNQIGQTLEYLHPQ